MKRNVIILLHGIYWFRLIPVVTMILSITGNTPAESTLRISFLSKSFFYIPEVITFYIFYSILFPHFFKEKRYWEFAIYGLFAFLAVVLVLIGGFKYFIEPEVLSLPELKAYPLINFKEARSLFSIQFYLTQSFDLITTSVNACLLKGFISWYSEKAIKENLERKNLQTELALLRAQINPHFLFNTLNNIDILIEEKPKTASLYLNKLSDIMRFTIYDSSSEAVTLSQELEYIEKYIELQRIRTSNENFVKFSISGNPGNLQIAPMLFIPFIENAFKHSTDKKIEDAIQISIEISGADIQFSCVNAINNSPVITVTKGGAGLEIIRDRLHLLYPNHMLAIQQSLENYRVDLTLNLNENQVHHN